MKFWVWLSFKLLRSSSKNFFDISGWVGLLGLMLGVASLVVSMSVMSGFEQTLKKNVIDASGHLQVFKPNYKNKKDFYLGMAPLENQVDAVTEFLNLEAVVAKSGKISGVMVQGIDFKDQMAVDLRSRLLQWQGGKDFELNHPIDSKINLQDNEALIGKGLAHRFRVNLGDEIYLVVPLKDEGDPTSFKRERKKIKIKGVLDLGRYEYDERMVFINISEAQKIIHVDEDKVSGFIVKLKNENLLQSFAQELSKNIGEMFRIRDWQDVNENLFEAVKIERVVIFFVVLIIVLAAAFNIATQLYVSVVRKYPTIGLLKALGISEKKIWRIFSLQGLMMGLLGLVGGFLLGKLFCWGFVYLESKFNILPQSVYSIDQIDLSLRGWDIIWIILATLSISVLVSVRPARKGAKLSPVEGLRYE